MKIRLKTLKNFVKRQVWTGGTEGQRDRIKNTV